MFKFVNVKFKRIIDIETLTVNEKKTTCFVGKSGGGKTTVLKLMNKLISPTEGNIYYNGKDIEDISTVKHRREVIMLSQNPVVFKGSIRDNLLIGLRYQKKELTSDKELDKCLDRVHLDKELDMDAKKLSGGEKQRLALARILLLDANVYLLDEPSASLDTETEEKIIEMVSGIAKENNKTLIMVTHSKSIADKYSDEIIKIENGNINI